MKFYVIHILDSGDPVRFGPYRDEVDQKRTLSRLRHEYGAIAIRVSADDSGMLLIPPIQDEPIEGSDESIPVALGDSQVSYPLHDALGALRTIDIAKTGKLTKGELDAIHQAASSLRMAEEEAREVGDDDDEEVVDDAGCIIDLVESFDVEVRILAYPADYKPEVVRKAIGKVVSIFEKLED